MNRTQYYQARRMLRDNGRRALRWMTTTDAQALRRMLDAPADPLAERAQILRDFGTYGAQQDVRYRARGARAVYRGGPWRAA